MNTLYWLVTITDRPTTDAFLKLYKSFGVDVSLRTVGAGTAVQETLSTLGLEKTEKAVLFAIITAAYLFGVSNQWFSIEHIPDFGILPAVQISILAVLCALVSIVFCILLHKSEEIYRKLFQNPYIRIFAGGCIVVILTMLVGNQNYNGTGIGIIQMCIDGTVRPEAFLLKMIFTALTLGAGYKGGEIVPSFFTGAAFGCLFGTLTGISPTLCTAVGMTAVFCGVTNCPITSLLISFELFGYDGMPYFLLAVAFSYMLSGYFGLYRSQKIVYSKYKTSYINKTTH